MQHLLNTLLQYFLKQLQPQIFSSMMQQVFFSAVSSLQKISSSIMWGGGMASVSAQISLEICSQFQPDLSIRFEVWSLAVLLKDIYRTASVHCCIHLSLNDE